MKRLLIFLALLLPAAMWGQCSQTAASSSLANMQTAVNAATSGQTACMPVSSGSVTWGTNTNTDVGLNVPAGIIANLEGWNITDNVYKGGNSCSGGAPLVTVNATSSTVSRVTNGTITAELISANCGESEEHIFATGANSGYFRVDHITFNGIAQSGANYDQVGINTEDAWGVVDHNTFNNPGDVFPTAIHDTAYQGTGWYGDNSWAQADTFGSESAVYMENNTYVYTANGPFPTGCFDAGEGGRLVFRFNTGCPFVGTHGLDSSGRYRSVRQWEVYNNSFTAQPNSNNNMYTGVFMRGGTGYVFSNIFTDTGLSTPYITLIQLNSYRDTSGYAPWGYQGNYEACDGRGPFDTNSGTTYASFTASSASSLDSTVATTSPGWSTNQWASGFTTNPTYSLVDTTLNWGSTIASNTSNTIVTNFAAQGGAGPAHTASNGDAMQIRAAYPCTDQIGRGAGVYVSGTSGTGGAPTPTAPINQALDPAYEWLNSLDGTTQSPAYTVGGTGYYHLHANRDYYGYASSFTGVTGVGSGTLGARPATCTTGTAYWDTSEGTWNNGASSSGALDKCTSTNTWTNAAYTPYTYPHPLVGGSPPPPTTPGAPANLIASPL